MTTTLETQPDRSLPSDPKAAIPRLEDLPKELGVMLASVGVLGVILPGMAGAPALLAGGLVLWPKTFGRVEGWFQGRFPATHREGMKQVGRFLRDLGRRYPQGIPHGSPSFDDSRARG